VSGATEVAAGADLAVSVTAKPKTEIVEPAPAVLYTATIRSPIAPMHCEPGIASQMVSQQLAGHRVDILDEEGDWARARGADDYEGWIHVGFLARSPRETGREIGRARLMSLGCVTRTAANDNRVLPLRAILSADETVTSGEAFKLEERAKRFAFEPEAITRSAQRFFVCTSYLWGGVTPWGADCSGLVQSVFALHGHQLPRDAWQQAERGIDAGEDVGDLRPADLLFFSDRSDGRITHVGISLGDRRMVHLALGRGGYAVERLDDRSDPYVDRLRVRFVCARRIARGAFEERG
jgi:cell wall-associated NlpC family hydrolase